MEIYSPSAGRNLEFKYIDELKALLKLLQTMTQGPGGLVN
jgi:hypothetical protein